MSPVRAKFVSELDFGRKVIFWTSVLGLKVKEKPFWEIEKSLKIFMFFRAKSAPPLANFNRFKISSHHEVILTLFKSWVFNSERHFNSFKENDSNCCPIFDLPDY